PAGIRPGQTHDQLADLVGDGWTAGPPLSAVAVIPFLRDQPVMPAQDRVGSEQRADLRQELAAQEFAFGGQAPALVVVEKDAALTEFLFQDLVFGAQVVDDLLLPAVHPAGEDDQNKLPRLQNEIHARSDAVGGKGNSIGDPSGSVNWLNHAAAGAA